MAESLQPKAGRPRVVAAAVIPARRAAILRLLGEVVAAGGSALLVTADGRPPPGVPDGVEVLDLAATERRVGVNTVLSRSPTRLARRLAGRPGHGPALVWKRWSRSGPYRAVRPWLLWRALRRHLDVVDVDRVDHVLLVGLESWPVAWQLCRRNPATTYAWEIPAEVYQRAGRRPPVPA